MFYSLNFLALTASVVSLGLALVAIALAWRSRRTICYLLNEGHLQSKANSELRHAVFELRRIVAPLHYKSQIDESEKIQSWAQHGEDLILFDLFQGKTNGIYLDVGAYDGLRLSNTAFLEKIGWRGVLIEAHPRLAETCRKNRPNSTVLHAAAGSETGPRTISFSMVEGPNGVDTLSFAGDDLDQQRRIEREGGTICKVDVPVLTLDQILQDSGIQSIDLVSIDVEGAEDQVLDGFDLSRWKPKAILMESNTDEAQLRTEKRLKEAGYKRLRRIGVNDLFVFSGQGLADSDE